MHFRPYRLQADVPRIVALWNTISPEPMTEPEWLEWEAKWPADAIRERIAAVDEADRVIGFGEVGRTAWMKPGKFDLNVVVDPDHHRRLIGGQLSELLERWALGRGATLLETSVRDHLEQAVAFAQRRGYAIDRHIFESTLEPAAFEPAPFAGVVDAVKAGGIRFLTLADASDEETVRQMYDVTAKTVLNIPGYDNPGFMPLEQFRKVALEGESFRPDCIILAADGDRVVGVTDMKPVRETGAMWTHYTGVHPDYRGRQIALALKLLAIETALRYGAPYMRTNNDSKNAPMLAVNRKLGYKPCPGEYRMRKPVE